MASNQNTTPFIQDDNNLMQQLLLHWELSKPILLGKYTRVKRKSYGFFNDVKNNTGELLSYPQQLGRVSSIYVHRDDLEEGAYYEFSFCLASLEQRQNKNNSFLVQTDRNQPITKINHQQVYENNIYSTKPDFKTSNMEIDNFEKKWIDEIFNSKGIAVEDARDLAGSLNILSEDLYTKAERFIFELLQNADDFPGELGKVQIKFVILQEHLLILHTGKKFSKEEVQAICRIANSTKPTDASTTGYKGIGFKSVFAHADCVYLFSGNYQFRYDKNFYPNPEITPWQIKPIWTDKDNLPQEIRLANDFFKYPVAIGLYLGRDKANEYKQKIRKVFSEPRFMLFLRHVNLIDISGLVHDLKMSLQLDKDSNFSKISYNGKFRDKWLVQDFVFEVPQNVQDKIKNDHNVPTKLRKATKTKLSFAAKIDNEKLVALSSDESTLFSYLPTNVKDYQFPLLVNADFLTKADREDLHRDNAWNCFIFEQIGYNYFKFLAWLYNSCPQYKNYTADLIPFQFNDNEKIAESFNQGFDKAINDIAFIPSDEIDNLLKVSEVIIDETGITEIIGAKKIKSILNIQKYFVSRSLNNHQKLQSLGVEIFGFNQLANLLKQYSYEDLKEYIQIIIHLKNKKYAPRIKELKLPIIWDENGNLIASTSEQSIYFETSPECRKLLTFDQFVFINPKLDKDCQQNRELRDSLLSLGVKYFNPIEVIRERIKKGKFEPKDNNFNDHINHIRFIFQYRHELTDNEYKSFSNFKLLYRISDKYYPAVASICYLSDYYQPKYLLEFITNNLEKKEDFKFIISNYCEQEKDITAWKQFFLKFRIVQPDGLEILNKFIIPLINKHQINEINTIEITRFIFSVFYNQSINAEIKYQLSNLLLLTNDGLKRVVDCNLSEFYINSSESLKFLQEFQLPNLVCSSYCNNNETREKWQQFFINIGVKGINGIELVKAKIALLPNKTELININNVLKITTQIFNYHRYLSQEDFEKLFELPILVKNGQLVPANECYLSNDYHPKQDLESLFAQTDFYKIVSPLYINENNVETWKQFFLKIQVAEEIRVLKYTQRYSFEFNGDVGKAYLKFIQVSYADNYDMEDFLEISDIDNYIENYEFAYKFWSYLKQNWDRMNLDAKSKIWISSHKTQIVDSCFKFLVTQYPSIPCIDKQCRKPSEVYSYSLKSLLMNCNLPVSAIEFPIKIESFLRIKTKLDIKAYLKILDNKNANFSQDRDTKNLLLIYEQLANVVQGSGNEDKALINEWSKTGQLLACDEQLHCINELFYIDSTLDLPYKRNSRLVKFPENLNSYKNFKYFLSFFNVNKIQSYQVFYDVNNPCKILPQLIRDRVYYISVYLVGSTNPGIVNEQSEKIILALNNFTVINPSKLYYSVQNIDYEEAIHNFYDSINNQIIYVGRWNSRKNAKIGEYLIKALGLNEKKISSEKLLDFLDDPLDEIVSYFREGGFEIPEPSHDTQDTKAFFQDLNDNDSVKAQATSSIISRDKQGIGENPEEWGEFGENKAKLFYQECGYTVSKQPDGTGYDFRCVKLNSELFVEVKTINPNYNDVIRITPNEWQTMCNLSNQDKYELLIVIHIGKLVTKMIRIQSAWKTLQEVFSELNQQPCTSCSYNSHNIEVLIGLQGNSNNSGNDIIFNWKRLVDNPNFSSRNIQEIK